MYKVTVTQKVMDTSRLNPYFTIQKALTKKKIANDIYTNEWCKPPETNKDANCDHSMKRAVRLYTKVCHERMLFYDCFTLAVFDEKMYNGFTLFSLISISTDTFDNFYYVQRQQTKCRPFYKALTLIM